MGATTATTATSAISVYPDAREITRQLDELIAKPIYSISPAALAAYEEEYFEKKCATFIGGGGDKYATTLIGCTCPDFVEREKPCKHMYWLAHELGVDDGEE